MGERKHKSEAGEKKSIQPRHEEEQRVDKHPAEALKHLAANVAQPSDILALQKTVGNQAVQRLLAKRGIPGETKPDISRQDSASGQGSDHNHAEYVTNEEEYQNRSDLADAIMFAMNAQSTIAHEQRVEIIERVAKLESKEDQ